MIFKAKSASSERICCPCLRIKWKDGDITQYEDVEEGKDIMECTCADEVDEGEKMLPAGLLIHLVPVSDGNQNTDINYTLKVVDEATFYNINVCSNMVSDHMPPAYINSLKIVNKKWGEFCNNVEVVVK